ncbi:hypothetical protein GCM10027049_23490 [Mucilaginibacter puniceus]
MSKDITTESKYNIFIEKIAASKLVWGLQNKNGWANSYSNDSEEVDVIPFWEDRFYAKSCAVDGWKGYAAASIPLSDFLENWCVGMIEENILAGINWDPKMNGNEVAASKLAIDILDRLKAIDSAIEFFEYDSIEELTAKIKE